MTQWKDADPGCFLSVAGVVLFAVGMGSLTVINGDPGAHFFVFCVTLFFLAFGKAFDMPPSKPEPPEPRPKPRPLRPKSLERTERGTDPKYTWRFTPDNCFDCGLPFRERSDDLSFYTVVIDCRMTRCCPECFPRYQDRWMG